MINLQSKSFLIFRWIVVVAIASVLGYSAWKNLKVEQDIALSIERSRPQEAAIFNKLKGSGLFQNRVFIHIDSDRPDLELAVRDALLASDYLEVEAFESKLESPKELYALLPFLPEEQQRELLSQAHQEKVLLQVRSWLASPTGLGMLKVLEHDPLLLSQELPKLIQTVQPKANRAPLIGKRSGDIDYEKVRQLYSFLKSHNDELSFVSGDFFALENYDSVRRDIRICSVLSLILSLFVFRFFCSQWSLLGFLIIGTLISTATGLWVAERFDGTLYALVLVFTSTFLSFNTESLVHLAGLKSSPGDRKSIVGIFSSLGTTIIGFSVLFFSSSQMARQLGLISLGSLIGFVIFLLIFMDSLKDFAFRSLRLPQWIWTKKALGATFGLVTLLIVLLPKPDYRTNLEQFRFSSDYLDQKSKQFSEQYAAYSLEGMSAFALNGDDPFDRYQKMTSQLAANSFHPLSWYRTGSPQTGVSSFLQDRLAAMNEAFRTEGLNIQLNPQSEAWLRELDSRSYLKLWNKFWPLPWYEATGDGDYLLLFVKDLPKGAIPLHPKAFYEHVLSGLTQDLGELFLLGLGLMLLYLIPWQRKWSKIALIFLPLMISALVLQILFYLTGRTITIIHIMGLSLVIAVALDYASVLVSSDHNPESQGKVALTGSLTLTSFGSLLLASHPVLKELAMIVVIGTAVSFVMALFTALPEEEGRV